MGLLDPKKGILTDNEIDIIRDAYKQVSKCSFNVLYFNSEYIVKFKAYGHKNEEEAMQQKAKNAIELFFHNNGNLHYVILSSKRWLDRLDASKAKDEKILEALGGLSTMLDRLKGEKYMVHKNGGLYYPSVICYETEEKTREFLLRLLQPLLKLR